MRLRSVLLRLNLLWPLLASIEFSLVLGQESGEFVQALENPPVVDSIADPGDSKSLNDPIFIPLTIPNTEWAFHKTGDGAHPSGLEQAMVWLTNRARTDPESEGIFLGALTAANILANYNGFGVNLPKMMAEFAALDPRPPVAFDARIWDAVQTAFGIYDCR